VFQDVKYDYTADLTGTDALSGQGSTQPGRVRLPKNNYYV